MSPRVLREQRWLANIWVADGPRLPSPSPSNIVRFTHHSGHYYSIYASSLCKFDEKEGQMNMINDEYLLSGSER